jgi:transposase
MEQQELLTTEERTKLDSLSREELVELIGFQQKWVTLVTEENKQLRKASAIPPEQILAIQDQILLLRNRMFGKSSERRVPDPPKNPQNKMKRKEVTLLPSRRYPNLPLVETEITFDKGHEPECKLCGEHLVEMGQSEDSEVISIVPKVYHIRRFKRAKYRCEKCHGDIQTAPVIPRIVPGGSFSDELIIDVVVSKYADHCVPRAQRKEIQHELANRNSFFVRNSANNGGGPSETALQDGVSNHHQLLWPKSKVVNVMVKVAA